LRSLQKLDQEIAEARARVSAFDPILEQVAEPAAALEKETESVRTRLKEMKVDQRRLELSAEEKQGRLKRLQERLNGVKNLREEAAVRVELDIVRRALETDEQEIMSLMDQVRRSEEQLRELDERRAEAVQEVEPRRLELVREQTEARSTLEGLEERRKEYTSQVGDKELRIYESFRAGGRAVVVAVLTDDGACGFCFSMVPLQRQSEVRVGRELIRCEACGVILAPPEGGANGGGG